MNHQILINFELDDESIVKNATEYAGRKAAEEVIDKTFGTDKFGYYNKAEQTMRLYVKDVINEILTPKMDEIVKEAINEVVKNIHRTKQVKEALAEQL